MTQQTKSRRGGPRVAGPGKKLGRPPKLAGEKREKHSPTLAPDVKELCQKIAGLQGYPGWGYAIDEAVRKLAAELGIQAAEAGGGKRGPN